MNAKIKIKATPFQITLFKLLNNFFV